jgi:hypothetical protein
VRVVENLRPVASPDKEQSTEGQHTPGLGRERGRAGASGAPPRRMESALCLSHVG